MISALLASVALAGLDFSPQEEEFELEGIKMSQLAFRTGNGPKAIYQPPRDWKYFGGNEYLDLQPAGLTQASAKVRKWPASPELSFDPEGRKRITEQIIASLPEGSEQVKLLTEEVNPLRICGRQTYLVELTYVYYGDRFACYTLLVERSPEMFCFRLSSREANYQALRDAFQRSLYSWQNL